MKHIKYFLFFVFFARIYSLLKIFIFKNEIDKLFILETIVASVIVIVVVYFLINYSETNN